MALLISSWLSFLPKPILSVVVIFSIIKLIDVRMARTLWSIDARRDLFLMGISFVATICLGVLLGIAVAVGTSIVLLIQVL